jgi:hypothetical protein
MNKDNHTLRGVAFDLVKLGLSGALICGIAWGFLVLDEEATVPDAEADIAGSGPISSVTGRNFAEIMDKSGMKPKPYEINGNDVFFSVGYSDESPREVLDYYQTRFVAAGINPKKFTEVPESTYTRTIGDLAAGEVQMDEYEKQYKAMMLNGGVVPLVVSDEQVTMGGTVVRGGKTKGVREYFPEWSFDPEGDPHLEELMEGFRFIEAKRTRPGGKTRITSVWADRDFDSGKMQKPNQKGLRSVVEAPACIGCSVGTQMRSRDPSEPYSMSNMYTSRSIVQTREFYAAAMKNRGWQTSDATEAINYARTNLGVLDDVDLLSFTRGGVESTILLFDDPKERRTRVSIVESR